MTASTMPDATRPPVVLRDLAAYLPDNRVPADYFARYAADDDLADNVMFAAPAFRHHAADGLSLIHI